MKIIFAGTPDFAVLALQKIVHAGFDVVGVLTQPDRRAGRGMKLVPSAVKETAKALNLPLMQPETLKDEDVQAALRALNADVMVVVAYGLLLPRAVLQMPRYGCLNIHASLLPRWRGAAPIQRAIEAGDAETGVCIMQMDEGLDTGDVLSRRKCAILPHDTAADLHDRLARMGADEIVVILQRLPNVTAETQSDEGVTYAAKIVRKDACIDWSSTPGAIDAAIRAFNPYPGAWTTFEGETLKIWKASPLFRPHHFSFGTVVAVDEEGMEVACAEGSVKVLSLQAPGGKKMAFQAFARGRKIRVGDVLGCDR